MPRKTKPVAFCLGVSHVDKDQAMLWLRWAAYLSSLPGGDVSDLWLMIVCTRRVGIEWWREAKSVIDAHPTFFCVTTQVLSDEDERGYPGSASHLFVRAMQCCERSLPGHPKMYCEPDTAPMRPSWARELAAEYQDKGSPFLGVLVASTHEATETFGYPPYHVTGNAIYPAEVFKHAPSLLKVLNAVRDNRCPWRDKGYAWDLFSAHEIVPLTVETKLIQQIWRPDPFDVGKVIRLIMPDTVFFHQSKDGSLIAALASRGHQAFLDSLPPPEHVFCLVGSDTQVKVGGRSYVFTPCFRDPGGRRYSVLKPVTKMEEVALLRIAGTRGVSVISHDEYRALLAQAK
jgi:hypothetical protein